ncbi:hypothetical protein BOMU111920_06005 [Bordetella muralis]
MTGRRLVRLSRFTHPTMTSATVSGNACPDGAWRPGKNEDYGSNSEDYLYPH